MAELPRLLGDKVTVLAPRRHADDRGLLSVYDFGALGFSAVRSFIVEAPDGTVRGGHGHRRCRQIWVRLVGEIEVELRHGGMVERLILDASRPALLVEPPVWGQQTYRGAGAKLLVHCDQPYDADDVLKDPV